MPRDLRREQRLQDVIRRAQSSALSRVRGLFKRPGEPGYNPDAEKTWKECTVATRAALALAQGSIAAERAASAANAAPRMLGVVAVMPRIESSSEWEAFAKQVHDRPQLQAIDVVVEHAAERVAAPPEEKP